MLHAHQSPNNTSHHMGVNIKVLFTRPNSTPLTVASIPNSLEPPCRCEEQVNHIRTKYRRWKKKGRGKREGRGKGKMRKGEGGNQRT